MAGIFSKKVSIVTAFIFCFSFISATVFCRAQLIEASRNNDLAAVEFMVNSYSDLETRDNFGNTALIYAVKNHNRKMARLLLLHGADPNAKNLNGDRPLHFAAVADSKKLVADLLAYDADPKGCNNYGLRPAMIATVYGNKSLLSLLRYNEKVLLNRNGKTVDNRGFDLFAAVLKNKWFATRRLLKDGVDPDFRLTLTVGDNQFSGSVTALHLASKLGHKSLIKQLIKYGANVNSRDDLGRTPLFYAVLNDYTGCAVYLLKKGGNPNLYDYEKTGILHLVSIDNASLIKKMIPHVQNINEQDDTGNTPLIHAVRFEHSGVVKKLIVGGADLNIVNVKKNSALHYAASNGDKSLVKLLIRKGASLDLQNEKGQSPLHIAIIQGHPSIVDYLLKNGADYSLKTNKGLCPARLKSLPKSDKIKKVVKKYIKKK